MRNNPLVQIINIALVLSLSAIFPQTAMATESAPSSNIENFTTDGETISFEISLPEEQNKEDSLTTSTSAAISNARQMPPATSLSTRRKVTCRGTYDWPHASVTDQRRTINAHLRVSCSGTGYDEKRVKITASSRMIDSKARKGIPQTRIGWGYVQTPGVLSCTSDWRIYQAVGSVVIQYPADADRRFDNFDLVSQAKYFRLVDGKCELRS